VEGLADDVRRHLDGTPVVARKGTVRYRAGKFARKHAFGLGVTAAGVVAASAFLTFHVRAVAHERDVARREATRAEQVSGFVLDIFDRSDPMRQAAGDSLGIEELVEAGAARLQDRLQGQPEVRADMQIVLGRLMLRLGRPREGLELFEEALATRAELFGEESPEAVEAMIYVADAAVTLGRYADAAALQRRVLEQRRRAGAEPGALASALEELGRTEISLGHLADADSLISEALSVRRAFPGETPIALGHVLEYMANLRRHQGRLDEAADFARHAVAAYASHYGEEHRGTRELQRQLGLVLKSDSRYEEAEAVYRAVLAGDSAELGDDHPITASSRHDLGSLLLDMRRLDEAEVLLRQALEAREATSGPTGARVGMTLSKLATVLTHQGRMDEAVELHRRALEIRRINVGARSSSVGTGLNQLGITLSNMGRAEEAIPVFREAADIYREQAGERHWWVAVAVGNEALAWHRLGDLSRADSLYRVRHAINEEALGPEHFSTAEALYWRGNVAAEQGRWEDAVTALSEALPVYEDRLPEDDPRGARLRSELGEALSMLGRFDQAEPLLVSAAEASDDPAVRRRLDEHRRRVEADTAGGGTAGSGPSVPDPGRARWPVAAGNGVDLVRGAWPPAQSAAGSPILVTSPEIRHAYPPPLGRRRTGTPAPGLRGGTHRARRRAGPVRGHRLLQPPARAACRDLRVLDGGPAGRPLGRNARR
jgi:tetratricopeptide (TPR) repeat protein